MVRRTLSCVALAWTTASCGSAPAPQPSAALPPTGARSPSAPAAAEKEVATPASVVSLAKGAVLFDDLGTLHRTVTTTSPEAQKYFDQGLRLSYGFNHDEATRSFAKAAELDPSCAMCFWGVAYTLGPNYNVPMLPTAAKAAWEALGRANALASKGTKVESALVGALTKRYKGPEPLDPISMQPLSAAYAEAMKTVAQSFPEDDDVQTLTAEAAMDTMPWKLWSKAGEPSPGTLEVVATLEKVLARNPNHPGANHFYIHAVEASTKPERAVAAAERLPSLMPGAGHLQHMPAHIFQRIGRYADASAANVKAVKVDEAYLQKVTPPGNYPMYLGHNYGFLAFSASMEGRSETAIDAARRTAKAVPPQMMLEMMPGMDFFVAEPLLVLVRFGKWDALLAEPRPEARYPVLTVFWLHGHGMALATKGKLVEARADLAELQKVAAAAPKDMRAGENEAKDVFAVAAKILEARIATMAKDKNALALWAEAVSLQDKLAYSEPDDWFYPVRHLHGAALLAANKAADAEAVYREDLKQHPHNGWALFGLSQALTAQKKSGPELASVKDELGKTWAKADVKLTSSAF